MRMISFMPLGVFVKETSSIIVVMIRIRMQKIRLEKEFNNCSKLLIRTQTVMESLLFKN